MRCAAFAFCCLLLVGCSRGPNPEELNAHIPPLKSMAEAIAQSGYLGSGMIDLEVAYEKLEKEDPQKAASVKPAYDELMKSEGNPNKIKKAAAELASQL
jgi:hypothetical protein